MTVVLILLLFLYLVFVVVVVDNWVSLAVLVENELVFEVLEVVV